MNAHIEFQPRPLCVVNLDNSPAIIRNLRLDVAGLDSQSVTPRVNRGALNQVSDN